MAIGLVHKRGLSVMESLSPEMQCAARAVMASAESEQLKATVLKVMRWARAGNR